MPELGKATFIMEIDSRNYKREFDRNEKLANKKTKEIADHLSGVEKKGWNPFVRGAKKAEQATDEAVGQKARKKVQNMQGAVERLSRAYRGLHEDVNILTRAMWKLNDANKKVAASLTPIHTAYKKMGDAGHGAFTRVRGAADNLRNSLLRVNGVQKTLIATSIAMNAVFDGIGRRGRAIGAVFASVAQVMGSALSSGIEGVSNGFKAMNNAMTVAAGGMGGMLNAAGSMVASMGMMGAAIVAVIALLPVLTAGLVVLVGLVGSLAAAAGGIAALGIAFAGLFAPIVAVGIGAIAKFKDEAKKAGTEANRLKNAAKSFGEEALKAFGPASNAIFSGMSQALNIFKDNLAGLKEPMHAVGSAIGFAFRDMAKAFTSPAFMEFFAVLSRASATAIPVLTRGFVALATILANITRASLPLLQAGLQGVVGWLEKVATSTGRIGQTRGAIAGMVQHFNLWWNLIKAVGAAIWATFKASEPFVKAFLGYITGLVNKYTEWANSAAGQQQIRTFLASMVPIVKSLFKAFADIVVVAFKIGQVVLPIIMQIGRGIGRVIGIVKDLKQFWDDIPGPIKTIIGLVILMFDPIGKLRKAWLAVSKTVKIVGTVIGSLWAIGSDVAGKIGNAFKKAWSGIKSAAAEAWDWIKNAAVNTINFIIDILNKIPFVDIGKVGGGGGVTMKKRSGTPTGNAGGDPAGRFATGGKVNRPMAIVGEEAPQHPEYVIATNPAYRKRNMGLWMQAGQELGVPGFGIGGALKSAAGTLGAGASKIGSAVAGAAKDVGGFLLKPAKWFIDQLPSPTKFLPEEMKGFGKYLVDEAKDFILSKVGMGGGNGGAFGPGVNTGTWKLARKLASMFGLQITDDWRPQNAGYGAKNSSHKKGSPANPGAHDFVPPSPAAQAEAIRMGAKWADIHDYGTGLHLHVSWFKKGGVLQQLAQGGVLSGPQIATLASNAGLSQPQLMAAIALAESRGNPRAHNTRGEDSRGLWQINVGPGANTDLRGMNLFNPATNARAAKIVRDRQGLSAWTMYRNNEYKNFLNNFTGKARNDGGKVTGAKKQPRVLKTLAEKFGNLQGGAATKRAKGKTWRDLITPFDTLWKQKEEAWAVWGNQNDRFSATTEVFENADGLPMPDGIKQRATELDTLYNLLVQNVAPYVTKLKIEATNAIRIIDERLTRVNFLIEKWQGELAKNIELRQEAWKQMVFYQNRIAATTKAINEERRKRNPNRARISELDDRRSRAQKKQKDWAEVREKANTRAVLAGEKIDEFTTEKGELHTERLAKHESISLYTADSSLPTEAYRVETTMAEIAQERANLGPLAGPIPPGMPVLAPNATLPGANATAPGGGAAGDAAADTAAQLAEFYKSIAIDNARKLAVSQAQYPIFSNFIGAFETGTPYIPETGFGLLHRGEAVIPADLNPFAEGDRSFSSSSNITLNMSSDLAALDMRVEAIVDGKQSQITRKVNDDIGRRVRMGLQVPGGTKL